jgi:hypothetical protein
VERGAGDGGRPYARVARVELTGKGDKLVSELTAAHLAGLYELAAALNELLPPGSGSAVGGGVGLLE